VKLISRSWHHMEWTIRNGFITLDVLSWFFGVHYDPTGQHLTISIGPLGVQRWWS
jgi:hypothetical protein